MHRRGIALHRAATSALADNPMLGAQLTSVFPAGGKQGATVDVAIAGTDLDDATTLIFSHPGLSAMQKVATSQADNVARPVPNQFAVTISGTVPPGLYEVRAAGPVGHLQSTYVRRRHLERSGGSRSARQTVGGPRRAARIDGQRVDAARTGRLFQIRGQEGAARADRSLALAESIRGSIRDWCFTMRPAMKWLGRKNASTAIRCSISSCRPTARMSSRLYDFLYKGGPDYFYRLTLSTAPRLDFVMPPSGLAGSTSKYTLYGRNLPGGTPSGEQTASGTPLERLDVEIELPANPAAVQRFGGDAFAEPTEFAIGCVRLSLANASRRNQSREYLFRDGAGRQRERAERHAAAGTENLAPLRSGRAVQSEAAIRIGINSMPTRATPGQSKSFRSDWAFRPTRICWCSV